jgi:hypothetical protein
MADSLVSFGSNYRDFVYGDGPGTVHSTKGSPKARQSAHLSPDESRNRSCGFWADFHFSGNLVTRWDEKAGLPRDAIRSQGSTCSRHNEKETGLLIPSDKFECMVGGGALGVQKLNSADADSETPNGRAIL